MKTKLTALGLTLVFSLLLIVAPVQAQDVYDSKTVWNVTTIRIDANMNDKYLERLSKTWKITMDEALKEGLILSYKVLLGSASNEEDYNLLLMVENSGMADYDPNPERDAKWDAIEKKVIANLTQEGFDKTIAEYGQIRRLFGSKILREIELK